MDETPGGARRNPAVLRVVFDYVDPGSYLAAALLRREEAGTSAADVEWVPLELCVPSAPRIDPFETGWMELTSAMAAEAAKVGIPFRSPRFVPWTRKAHELALMAREKGCFETLHSSLFEAHFVGGRDIGRVDVLVEIGQSVGLDVSEVRTVLGVERFGPRVEAIREVLIAEGVRGVPTVEVNGRTLAGFKSAAELTAFVSAR